LTAYFYFDPKAGKLRFRVISEVNIALAQYFKEHGISFAYPHEVKTFDTQDVALQHLVQDYVRYS
jgi:small-conductance mechanosensitive channel